MTKSAAPVDDVRWLNMINAACARVVFLLALVTVDSVLIALLTATGLMLKLKMILTVGTVGLLLGVIFMNGIGTIHCYRILSM